ncbi:DegT/DnrJ/EryC1/StrS family aminotransferase, partial [Thermodesulfobacteriota bacterium]
DAAATAWYENANKYNALFEEKVADYLGVDHAISLPSCTSAIHLSLLALDVGSGDEIVVPDVTWIATVAPIIYVGAKPVFADIDKDTWCIDVHAVEKNISKRTKAIISVDLYGNMPDYDALKSLAQEKGLFLIEDAAEAIGSEYKGGKAGSFGHTNVLSFHGSKTLTTGEGGMLLTNDRLLYDRILFLRDHGRKPGDFLFNNEEVAYKYKMSSLQAALGLAQIERIEELVDRKRQIYAWYKSELADLKGIQLNCEPHDTKNSYWMVTAVIDAGFGLTKVDLFKKFKEKNIDSRPFFNPLSSLPAFEELEQSKKAFVENKNSYAISRYGINLPSALNLTHDDVKYVCDVFKQLL